jgi:hypothetical protein
MNALSIANPDLYAFISRAKAGGIPDDALVPLLRQNGWSERRVYGALSQHYAESLGTVVPSRSGPAENARDGFLYLVNFITLGFWATALGSIFYVLIAHRFTDATDYAYYHTSLLNELSWQLATLIIAFPIFFVVHRLIEAQLARRPDAADSGVRLWLTYVALVIAALVCMGDGIWFLGSFLRGEMTTRFVLDSIVLAVISGGIFTYYLSGLRRPRSDEE